MPLIPNNNTLLIHKVGNVFQHYRNLSVNDFVISDFYWEVDEDDYFRMTKLAGAQLYPYQFQNVSIQVDTGAIEFYTSKSAFVARLFEINYPNQYPISTTGVQSVTGTAVDNTDPANPIINSTGSSTPETSVFTYTSGAKTFTIGAGKNAIEVHVNTSYLRSGDWSQSGDVVTLTSDLFGGEEIEILNQ